MGKILMRHKFGHKIFCASQEVHLVEHGQKQLKIPKYTFLVQYAKIPLMQKRHKQAFLGHRK